MGRRLAAVQAMARCSPSVPMAWIHLVGVLRTCIVLLAATELLRMPDWFYRVTPCMGRPGVAAVRAMAWCSPSTPMAPVLQSFTYLRLRRLFPGLTPTATEFTRMPD